MTGEPVGGSGGTSGEPLGGSARLRPALLVMAEMTLRGAARRRASLALLLLLPLAFYVARHELVGQSIRFLALGLAWAVSTVALFAAIEAHESEARLLVGAWRRRELVAGRVLALGAAALALALLYLGVVLLDDRPVADEGALALLLLVTAAIGVALGTALGAVVARELEGALLLFIVAGLQFIADPETLLAHALPFWSTREIATFAVDGGGAASLGGGLAHAALTLVVLGLVTAAAGRRTRLRAGRRG